ncbi:hypothetical protein [Hydrogenophaga sp.]|uniref:hypothetical protein n=1 Tax=Hydrogenophaga sp. TaxID=1904254 RepID=UPI003F6ADE67
MPTRTAELSGKHQWPRSIAGNSPGQTPGLDDHRRRVRPEAKHALSIWPSLVAAREAL